MSGAPESRFTTEGDPLEESSCGRWLGAEAHVGSPVSSPRQQRLPFPNRLGPLTLIAVFVAGLALGVSLATMAPFSATTKS